MNAKITIKELREICQGPKSVHDTWYVKTFLRSASIYVTRMLIGTSVTPNQVTCAAIFIGISASLCFLAPQLRIRVLGVILLQLWFIFDAVDGEIARYRKVESVNGVFFDRVADKIVHPVLFGCIALGLYARQPNPLYLLAGWVFGLAFLLTQYVRSSKISTMAEFFTVPKIVRKKNPRTSWQTFIRRLATTQRMLLLVFLGTFLQRLEYVLYFYTLFFSYLFIKGIYNFVSLEKPMFYERE